MINNDNIGQVTEEERDEIKKLFNRKNSITELLNRKDINDEIYSRLLNDFEKTNDSFQQWWDSMQKKYNWNSKPEYFFTIDFESCKIFYQKK